MTKHNFDIKWIDAGCEPTQPSNPDFPDGLHIDLSDHHSPSCKIDLPYPGKRCGIYELTCLACGMRAMICTAGRKDDPRSVRLNCILPQKSELN